jgi:hypothetical protein
MLRLTLVIVTAFVALTAAAGGVALIVGSTVPELSTVLVPPGDYLRDSPFDSYVVPGAVLILLVAVPHAIASIATARRAAWALVACTVAGFACLIWIFVQMIYIPFSPLQAIYFAAGLVELGLVLLGLGVLRPFTRAAGAPRRGQHTPAR